MHSSAIFLVAKGLPTYREAPRRIVFQIPEPTFTHIHFQVYHLVVISFICLYPKVLRGRPAWELATGEEVEVGVRAPFFSIPGPGEICNGSVVAYVAVR